MDFRFPERILQLAARVAQFVTDEVIPLETETQHGATLTKARLAEVRAKAKAAGIWAPSMPPDLGGLGLNILEQIPVFEAAGRSLLGPLSIQCNAPDEGNMHLLERFANPEQRERYLRPLVNGDQFSAFSMTEPPPGAGSDPTMLRTTARRAGDGWILNGHKWFSSNGVVADFLIIMARHDDDTHAHQGATLFLTPIDAPGIKILRDVPTMGLPDFGGHVEMRYHDLRLPDSAILGEPGQGFALAQHRLGPARLTHCMRWTGIAQRALEIATDYASRREAFGKALAEQGAIQTMLADSDIELHAGRMMVQQAAWLLDQGERARRETSICKVHVSESVHRVLDRAIQICGGSGYSRDLPLSAWYETARAFRIYDGASEVHRMVIARYIRRRFGATDA